MAEETRKESVVSQVEKHRQVGRSVRTIAIVIGVCYCLRELCNTALKVIDKPPWLTLVLALIGPSGLFAFVISRIRAYTKRTASRVAAMEKDRDPNRTSSGLLADGQTPPEEKP